MEVCYDLTMPFNHANIYIISVPIALAYEDEDMFFPSSYLHLLATNLLLILEERTRSCIHLFS